MENNNIPESDILEKTVSVDDVIMPELPDVPDLSSIIMPEQDTVINSDIPMPEFPDTPSDPSPAQTPQYSASHNVDSSDTAPQQTPQYGQRFGQDAPQGQTPTYNYNAQPSGIPTVPTAGSSQPQGVFGVNSKSKVTAGLLGIFFGCFGAHNFYLGYKAKAIIQLCLTVIAFGCGGAFISFIWSLIEAIRIFAGSVSCDAYGNPIE